ncbi:hypothetical protein [Methylotuvimicrobium buryatense]|uniref:Uncharacterized protein n=1 Tax=Methylotuvimicrobium buryatense TaxID=95641 RepID=A0A4P9UQN5_METBY|nr:hypothetical protein [Methylotuvimicrobium buryatense]QCW83657.1 hypothetical protein EQU24_16470 [Methylotuvimicrobium buryatense]
MQAYYEIETEIPKNHQLNLSLPDDIPAGKAKVAIIYEFSEPKDNTGMALTEFLNKYQTEDIDVDTQTFEENRKTNADRDFRL